MIEKFYAKTIDGQIHGRRVAGDGIPVVLLHRTPVHSGSFDRVLHFCAAHGQSAIALDSPGFGESFMPLNPPSSSDYGRWLLEAIDSLDVHQFHLAAHHTGTHFAAEIAAAAPGRVGSLTLSGILLAPKQERGKLRADIKNAPTPDIEGTHFLETFTLIRGLFLDPIADLVHAEAIGALVSGRGRDYAFDAIFDQDFEDVLRSAIQKGVPVQVVQAVDDPLTLNGMLNRFREKFPTNPITISGPAFLAMPERQSGAFSRAILDVTKGSRTMDNRRYHLVKASGGYDLSRRDGVIPDPGTGEVVVKVHAVSLNRRDLGIRDLSYPVNGADLFTPLSDAAGEIVAIGDGVKQWRVGDRVVSSFFQNFQSGRITLPGAMSALGSGGPGVLADYIVLSDSGITSIPNDWQYEEAACIPCAGVTAWSALKTLGRLRARDRVLIIGTGGVALFAIQIATASGAKSIVLSSSDDKISRAMSLGADSGINYRQHPDWSDEIRKSTGGMGVDHVVELGGVGTLQKSIAALGLGGHLALIGALDGFGGEFNAMPLIFSALRVSAVMVGSQEEQRELIEFMATHRLKPVIDRIFGFDNVEAAYRHAAGGAFGKVVISLAG